APEKRRASGKLREVGAENDRDTGHRTGTRNPHLRPDLHEAPHRPEAFADHVIRRAGTWNRGAQSAKRERATKSDQSAERPDEVAIPEIVSLPAHLTGCKETPRAGPASCHNGCYCSHSQLAPQSVFHHRSTRAYNNGYDLANLFCNRSSIFRNSCRQRCIARA